LNVYQALTYETARMTIGPLVSFLLRLKGEGEENIPAEGGALVVCNHRNPVLDPMCVALRSERQINFVAASVAFGIPVVSQLFRGVGAMPLDVFGGEKSKEGLEHVVQMVQTFRTGFARIALKAKVPIVPVAVVGTGERNLPTVPPSLVKPFFDHPEFQKGVQWTYYKRAFVRIGRPLDLSGYYDQEMTKDEIDQISGKVRRIIIKLYDGEDRERFVTGELPFDIAYDRV
jgi:1-acyl-sn-glycerol-3-phosphate acyltransferase